MAVALCSHSVPVREGQCITWTRNTSKASTGLYAPEPLDRKGLAVALVSVLATSSPTVACASESKGTRLFVIEYWGVVPCVLSVASASWPPAAPPSPIGGVIVSGVIVSGVIVLGVIVSAALPAALVSVKTGAWATPNRCLKAVAKGHWPAGLAHTRKLQPGVELPQRPPLMFLAYRSGPGQVSLMELHDDPPAAACGSDGCCIGISFLHQSC